ncbi:MAG: FTR1 family protein [Acidobacteriia bacterium]|nr:FTR1 family protein [Methyloceanibacter sp.]MBX5471772.1 FTR1 family protein [Acetobacteraceae bacterium]MCL6491862.1 FTR1 family protein [Terriglobia bacterium]
MLGAAVITFREVIEAGLIVGIVLAASHGVVGRGRVVSAGIALGVLGAALLAAFADQLNAAFVGSGQELFQAAILLAAVVMLAWHNIWMASHGRAMAREMRALGTDVSEGRRPVRMLGMVVGIAVLREGSEVVLFLYGIAAAGGVSGLGILGGGVIGLAGGVLVAALMYRGLLAIPAGRLFAVTGWLITLLAAGMASQAVVFLQQGGYAAILAEPLWDTRWLLAEDSILGRLAHTLVGYTDQPDGLQLLAYGATILAITMLARTVRASHQRAQARLAAESRFG